MSWNSYAGPPKPHIALIYRANPCARSKEHQPGAQTGPEVVQRLVRGRVVFR